MLASSFEYIHQAVIPAAYTLLPVRMRSDAATALLLAIGLQESRLVYRTQVDGPAHGFWQFERGGGVYGVLTHRTTGPILRALLLDIFHYPSSPQAVYEAITHNDVMAAVCARLLLYTVPAPLPQRSQAQDGWQCYLAGWRPGKPHPETWGNFFAKAWHAVDGPSPPSSEV